MTARREKPANVVLIGCGPHAKRTYMPALQALEREGAVRLRLVVDLDREQAQVTRLLRDMEFACEAWFEQPFSMTLPRDLEHRLDDFCTRHGVSGVIIATEPLIHRAYAEWALRRGLSVLIDKPITTRAQAVSCLASARGILDDYHALHALHAESTRVHGNAFLVNTQRRFHPGFAFVSGLIREVAEWTNCPVTFLQAYHCDGQWRFPGEMVTQEYHPFHSGYGKASHSGYHVFDMLYRLYAESVVGDKSADSMEVVSSFVQPSGLVQQFGADDYRRLFGGDAYAEVAPGTDVELRETFKHYGEVDLSALVTLKRDAVTVANFSVSLLHNGFARRTWVRPGEDLYKGNGRVKHEQYTIQQGPFQCIQIHSYQAKDVHDDTGSLDDHLGGNNHFDVVVFRNPLLAGAEPGMRVYTLCDILGDEVAQGLGLLTEQAKLRVVREFVAFLAGEKARDELRSQLEDHLVPVQIMSGVYQSHVQRSQGQDCVIRQPFGRGRPIG